MENGRLKIEDEKTHEIYRGHFISSLVAVPHLQGLLSVPPFSILNPPFSIFNF
jgi:hypothetical protein